MSDDEQPDDGNRCHNDRCRRVLTDGWTLCHKCSGHLADDLLEVADRFHQLTAAPAMEPGRYDRGGGGKPGSKPPLRLDIVALRDSRSGRSEPRTWKARDGKVHSEDEGDTPSVLRELGQWTSALAAELGHSLPAAELDDIITWLNNRDQYIARWWQAGALASAARQLRNRLRSATGEPNERPVGNCIRFVYSDSNTPRLCDSPIFLPPAQPGITPAVHCTGNPSHSYDGLDLARLEASIRAEREKQEQERKDGEQEAC